MVKHYKETPWWWYFSVLVIAFVFGIIVVCTEDITLPAWAYIVSLLLGIFISPFVSLHFQDTCILSDLSNTMIECHYLFPLR